MFEIIKLESCPLTLMRPSGTPSDQELTQTLQSITQFLEVEAHRQHREVIILDMSRANALRAGQRRVASEWMKRNNHHFKHVAMGNAMIIRSPLVRGVLTALLWVTPLEVPYDVFSNLDDAVRWAIKLFERERVPVPDRLYRELGGLFDAPGNDNAVRS